MPRLRRSALALLMLTLPALTAWAAEVQRLDVGRKDARYTIELQAHIDASPERVYGVLVDYEALPLLNPAVHEARVLARDGNTARVLSRTRACVSFFCHRFRQVQDMQEHSKGRDGGELSAITRPDQSDFRYGQAQWRVEPCAPAGTSCLQFSAEIEPDFLVPPLIGPWLIQRKMREEAAQTAQSIERRALQPLDAPPPK